MDVLGFVVVQDGMHVSSPGAGRSYCVKPFSWATAVHSKAKAVRCGQPQFYVTSLHATLHHNKPQKGDLPTFLSYYR